MQTHGVCRGVRARLYPSGYRGYQPGDALTFECLSMSVRRGSSSHQITVGLTRGPFSMFDRWLKKTKKKAPTLETRFYCEKAKIKLHRALCIF